jgi:hypothetical protein
MRATLRRFYERIDVDQNDIDEGEIRTYLKKIGVGDGFLGARAVDAATSEILRILDESADRRIQWRELVLGGKKLLPAQLLDAEGRLDRSKVGDVFESIVGKKKKNRDQVDAKDLAKVMEPEIRKQADSPLKAMFAPMAAAAAAKVAIDAIASDGEKVFTREDLYAIVDDINREVDALS